ncbi:MAG: SBBP repeat-containing protein [candidate division Zixibacteria bacterium]|nr:SBBP repeat-containing protein [candidate division Zixibacteria bacterium]
MKSECLLISSLFEGANPFPEVVSDGLMEYKCNYFLGNDSTKWRINVPNFSSITYKEIYPGIDLKYYGNGRQMEYDFIVAPFADVSQIRIKYGGCESLCVNETGELEVQTKWNTVTERTPYVYQIVAGEKKQLTGEYYLCDDNSFGFKLAKEYNPALAVVIDPVLTYSTYLGGSGSDRSTDIAINSSGQAYICGSTGSADFPVVFAYDNTINSLSTFDCFVTKFNATGNSLLFSTYLGGESADYFTAISIGAESGIGIFLTGYTYSADYPTTFPHFAYFGNIDAVLTGLSSTGDSLLYSTFFGGNSSDYGTDVEVRCNPPCSTGAFSVWITGATNSLNLPVFNASQTTNAGLNDAFIAQFTSTQFPISLSIGLKYCTYYGGSGSEGGRSLGISPTIPYKPYISGSTQSSGLPAMNGYDLSFGGSEDIFITMFDVAGNGQIYPSASTYFGGSGSDNSTSLAILSSGAVCVTGYTNSPGIATPGAFDENSNGFYDVFVAKFSSNLVSLNFCTYLGDAGEDYSGTSASALTADGQGNLYVTGFTSSSNFPTVNPYDATLSGTLDAFISKLSSNGSSLLSSTYLGGTINDYGVAIALDNSGCTYTLGGTYSTNFPLMNPFDGSYGGGNEDVFLTKMCLSCCVGTTGNVDCDLANVADISDLTALIDNLFISLAPLCCSSEANTDGDLGGAVDISDLTALIDHLFISLAPTAPCQ